MFLKTFVIAQEVHLWRWNSRLVNMVFLNRKKCIGCHVQLWPSRASLLFTNCLWKLERCKPGCAYFVLIPDFSLNWGLRGKWKCELVCICNSWWQLPSNVMCMELCSSEVGDEKRVQQKKTFNREKNFIIFPRL